MNLEPHDAPDDPAADTNRAKNDISTFPDRFVVVNIQLNSPSTERSTQKPRNTGLEAIFNRIRDSLQSCCGTFKEDNYQRQRIDNKTLVASHTERNDRRC